MDEYIAFGGGHFHYRQFFCRLTLYYTIEKYFLSTFFQTLMISSIYTKAVKSGQFHLRLDSWAAGLWLLYIYFTK